MTWCSLILLCVLPCVQFCTQAFNTYARLTDADVLFSSTMRYLKFFKYFWAYNAFLFAILALTGLAGAYFVRGSHAVGSVEKWRVAVEGGSTSRNSRALCSVAA